MDSLEDSDLRYPIILIFFLLTGFLIAISGDRGYFQAIAGALSALPTLRIAYTPIDLSGAAGALAATLQVWLLGRLLALRILPDTKRELEMFLASVGLGLGACGLIVTVLADFGRLFLLPVMAVTWCTILVLAVWRQSDLAGFFRTLRVALLPKYRVPSRPHAWQVVLALIFAGVFYYAIFFPILETDALIYHASMAKIIFHLHGLPFLADGSVGIGSSSNYPLLFSTIGSFYYVWAGVSNDLWLRLLGAAMGIFAVLTTYAIGDRLGGKLTAAISTILLITVPFFVSFMFQTTEEITLAFFVSVSFLFLLIARTGTATAVWGLSGLFFGFALLTSYQALYFLPAYLLVLTIYSRKGKQAFPVLAFLVAATMVGATPYIRNWVLLGDPVYPFLNQVFQSKYVAPQIFEIVKMSWNGVANFLLVGDTGGHSPALGDIVASALTYRSLFPLSFFLIVPALALMAARRFSWKIELSSFVIVPCALTLANPPSFIRYFLPTLPFAAVVVAIMISSANETCLSSSRELAHVCRITLTAVLALMLVFPSIVIIGGPAYSFIPAISPPSNYLEYTMNPGLPALKALNLSYGDDAGMWQWLNQHVSPREKVATLDYRIYYLNLSLRSLFYLDGQEAMPLYVMNEPTQVYEFLKNNNVTHVYIPSTASGLFMERLPLTKFLGSPYFPLEYAPGKAPGYELGVSKIYRVGPAADLLLHAQDPAYISQAGWTPQEHLRERTIKSIIEGDLRARLFAATPTPLSANLTFLDLGRGTLDVNFLDSHRNVWITILSLAKNDTGEWKTVVFFVPSDPRNGFVELGFYAQGDNFTVNAITLGELASYPAPSGKESYLLFSSYSNHTVNLTWANYTYPPTLMVYFPLMLGGEKVSITVSSFGQNASIDIFEGVIQNEHSSWWNQHYAEARSPALPVIGLRNPTLHYAFTPGLYTLVISLQQPFSPGIPFAVSVNLTST